MKNSHTEHIEKSLREVRLGKQAHRKPKTIYLAGGCFWGVQAYFQRIPGIIETEAGYANGNTSVTSYDDLHQTDHAETVRVVWDEFAVSLEEVLAHFYRLIDPTSVNRQGNDRGRQYRTGIYYISDADRIRAGKSLAQLAFRYADPIAVELQKLKNFVPAEDYHQDYLEKSPGGYCHINLALADKPLDLSPAPEPIPSREELQEQLSPLEFHVTQEEGTEAPYSSEFDQFDGSGIYVDIVSGEPLFSSRDKFDAGCGWPSFTRPIFAGQVDYQADHKLARPRVEVHSSFAHSHLGHVFPDGPAEQGGLRYCIDGAALRFISKEEMSEQGYGDLLPFVD